MKVFSGGHFMHEETFQVVVETCAMAQLCGQSPEWALAELKRELPGVPEGALIGAINEAGKGVHDANRHQKT